MAWPLVLAAKSPTQQLSGGDGYGQRACLDQLLAQQGWVQRAQAPWLARRLAKRGPQVASLEPTWPQQQLSELS